jgi:5-methylcytosine-specific restriction endonuclease McrA
MAMRQAPRVRTGHHEGGHDALQGAVIEPARQRPADQEIATLFAVDPDDSVAPSAEGSTPLNGLAPGTYDFHVGGTSYLCGQSGADTADHVISQADGGTHNASNLRAVHRRCTSAKGARETQECPDGVDSTSGLGPDPWNDGPTVVDGTKVCKLRGLEASGGGR